MKKTILALLMVALVATPCFAQEVETDGIFTIEETRWGFCEISVATVFPWVLPSCGSMGFYQGTVYLCTMGGENCQTLSDSYSYIDLLVVSIVTDINYSSRHNWDIYLAIMQPIGLGMFTYLGCWPSVWINAGGCGFDIGIMFKVDNWWTPYGG
jgi:hypothetical protein